MMNSYNENLHSTVVGALSDLDVAQQQVTSQANAAMFTLYHAEGAAITADEQLVAAKATLQFKESVKDQAVNNSNVSNNQLASAAQGAQSVKQSVTNTAVGAANIQVATTAIVRLAGDLGGIFSIVHAADFDTDIYLQTESVRELINETAYVAETISQLGMEASAAVAEVSASTVLDKSKLVNTAINNLLKIASADFDNANQLVASANASLAAVLASEKLAEGTLEDFSVDYVSARSAYNATNAQLNLGLRTSGVTNISFTAWFDSITNPFPVNEGAKPLYPVSQYYLVVAKETKQFTFSISDVENLMVNAIDRLVPVGEQDILPVPTPASGSSVTLPKPAPTFKKQINVFDMPGKTKVLHDSDGDEIQLGVDYVVFVVAVYQDAYKKKLNDFSDFLSAPSKSICLANQLNAVNASSIFVFGLRDDPSKNTTLAALPQARTITDILTKESGSKEHTYALIFVTDKEENKDFVIQNRCMLLPEYSDFASGMMTRASLKSLLDEDVQDMEKVFDTYDPLIAQYQSELLNLDARMQKPAGEAGNTAVTDLAAEGGEASATAKEAADLQIEWVQQRTTLQQQLKTAKADKQEALKNLQNQSGGKPGFFFNLNMAEQVPDDNYTIATLPDIDGNTTVWLALFGPNSTDNFGNRLMDGTSYIPAVLTASLAEESNQDQFLNALSDINATNDFKYAE